MERRFLLCINAGEILTGILLSSPWKVGETTGGGLRKWAEKMAFPDPFLQPNQGVKM